MRFPFSFSVFIAFRAIVSVFLCCCYCYRCYFPPKKKFHVISRRKKNIFLWKFSIYYKSFNSSSVYQNNAMVFVIRNDCNDVDTVAQSYEKSVSSTLSFSLDLFAPYFYSIFLKNHHGIPLKWRGRKNSFYRISTLSKHGSINKFTFNVSFWLLFIICLFCFFWTKRRNGRETPTDNESFPMQTNRLSFSR